jgi:hypothetical protein
LRRRGFSTGRKGRRLRGCADPEYSFPCIRVRIRLSGLMLFGWKCCFLWALAGGVGSPFQVPRGPSCASPGPAHRASSIAVPDFAHFYERLGFTQRDHSLTHQRIRTRNFHLINAQILKAHPYPNPSRHPNPRRAGRRKLVFRAETGAGRSPGDRTRSVS